MMWRVLLVCCGLVLTSPVLGQPTGPSVSRIKEIRVPKARSEHDVSYDYYLKILQRALVLGAKGRPIPRIVQTTDMEQGRAIRELAVHHHIDLLWAGVDANKNETLRPIHYPLERGLMGFRKFTIHQDLVATLDHVYSVKALAKMLSCQGLEWADNQILRQAGFHLLTSPVYENLFKQVNARRCDLFPRGLHEGEAELRERRALYPALTRYQDIMLHYPLAIYFYTSRDNQELAQWLADGLKQLNASGEHLRFMQQHPLTAHVFPLTKHNSSRWFELPNPDVTTAFSQDRRYWFTRQDFQHASL